MGYKYSHEYGLTTAATPRGDGENPAAGAVRPLLQMQRGAPGTSVKQATGFGAEVGGEKADIN